MLKKVYFALGFMLLAGSAHAQNDADLKRIAREICPCLTKILPQKYTDREVLNLDFGMCYMDVAEKYPAVFKKHDINILDMDNQEGAKLATLMLPYLHGECPAFVDVLYKLEDFYHADEEQDAFEEMSQYTMDGVFMGVEYQQFAAISIKDDTGKLFTFYWLAYFEGSNLLVDDAAGFVGKPVTIYYDEYNFYAHRAKTYGPTKVISGMRFR